MRKAMPLKAYSKDLRERVIFHIKSGNTQKSAAEIFKIGKTAVNRWWKRYTIDGCIESKPYTGSKGKGKIIESELIKYVDNNVDISLAQIAQIFKVSTAAICKKLKKLGYSYKKKPLPMWKRIR